MDPWPIMRLTVLHCIAALGVSGAFAGTIYVCKFLYPANSLVTWWLDKIDLMLAIIVPTALAIMFLSSLLRIVRDTIVSGWKGDSNGSAPVLLV